MLDWQTIAVALIIIAALLYVGRRGLKRLRSFSANKNSAASSCAVGCGNCNDDEQKVKVGTKRVVNIAPLKSNKLQ
ncbi:MAG TPA: hypothetical protein VK619_03330 [Pyrinomonadaceae bacterium]|nr:hypothetical protein [Pyrinomonadaceae bacterium]